MKRLFFIMFFVSLILIAGSAECQKIPYPLDMVLEGAAGVQDQFDVPNSPYYPRIDFYNMKSEGSLILIENFKTFQQTTETTCGPATLIMLLEHFGKYEGQGDRFFYEMRANHENPWSTLKDLITMLESTGEWEMFSTFDLEDPEHVPMDLIVESLRAGKPVIVGDDEWGGHWRVIIGYDDMGDDIEANDVLIIAEPYDTTDHFQDGYTIISFQRLYYNWLNSFDPDFKRNLFLIANPKQ